MLINSPSGLTIGKLIMKTKPFNLEAALRGEPVVTRDGRAVHDLVDNKDKTPFPLTSVLSHETWTLDGFVHEFNVPSNNDLFMLYTSEDAPTVAAAVDPRRGEFAARFMAELITMEGTTLQRDAKFAIDAADELIRQLDAPCQPTNKYKPKNNASNNDSHQSKKGQTDDDTRP